MFKRIREWFRAWRRGEKRVQPKAVRGRVYERKVPEQPQPGAQAKGRATATCQIQITRADGSIEKRTVPADITQLD